MIKSKYWLVTLALFVWPLQLINTNCQVSRAEHEVVKLKLRTLAGTDFSLSEQRGKLVVLSFSSVRFPLAGQTLPALEKLAKRYAGRNVGVYWVSLDSAKPEAKGYLSDADLQAFVACYSTQLTVLRDPDKTEFRRLRLNALPTVLVVGREGELLRTYVGFDAESGRGYRDVQETLDTQLW